MKDCKHESSNNGRCVDCGADFFTLYQIAKHRLADVKEENAKQKTYIAALRKHRDMLFADVQNARSMAGL